MFTNRPAMDQVVNGTRREKTEVFDSVVNIEKDAYLLRDQVQQQLLAETNGELPPVEINQLRKLIEEYFNELVRDNKLLYTRSTREKILAWVTADIIGYGPIEPLLNDPNITEIMVNGSDKIYVERNGLIESTTVKFENDAHLRRIIDRIVAPIGRRIDESSPMVDARLPSGFRVNAVIPPLTLDGPILTIRKFATKPLDVSDLIALATLNTDLATFLNACVQARINIVVSGGTGTGKTTLLNTLSSFIPSRERIITVEDTAELLLHQSHVVRLEKRPPNVEGSGEITIRQLVINALRMRPDRIIVGECRGGEALDMLQAMNTGHDGSMTTIHANSPRDALRRIETMVLMAGMQLPLKAIREQVASSIDMIIQIERMRDGTRKVTQVTEVQSMEQDVIVMQDIFLYKQHGIKDGRVIGSMQSTGLRPKFTEKFLASGIAMPDNIFMDGRRAG